MVIYFGHSRDMDYQGGIYDPIRSSSLNEKHTIVFPHENDNSSMIYSGDSLKKCDLMIADVSFPSTGLGIELGFASMLGKDIICVHKKGSNISSSLNNVTNKFIKYDNPEKLILLLEKELENY